MENKDIISISADCACSKSYVFNMEKGVKHMLCGELAKYIEEHFDELPIGYKVRDSVDSANEQIHKVTIDLANNLVPITLNTPNGQITAYISKDMASKVDFSSEIDQIVLKKKLTYGDLYKRFIKAYPIDIDDWRPAGKCSIVLYFKGEESPIKIYYNVAENEFYKCVKCDLHTGEEKKYEIKTMGDIWRDYNE